MRTATFRIKSASWLVIECEWIFRTRFRQQQLIIFLIINIIKMKHINVSTCISMRGVRVRVRVRVRIKFANITTNGLLQVQSNSHYIEYGNFEI